MSEVTDRLDAAERLLAGARAEAEAEKRAEASKVSMDDPDVRAAGDELARAIGRSLGVDMPLQMAGTSGLPVIELPPEVVQNGGVGIAVFAVRPPDSTE